MSFYHVNSKLHDRVQINQTNISQVQWKHPIGDCLCLNTDSTVQHRNLAGCEGLFKDRYRNWKRGFSKNFRTYNNYKARLLGVFMV